MNLVLIDYIFCFIILLFSIIGITRGFIDNIFGKLSWILAIIGAFLFYDKVSKSLLKGISNEMLANVLSFLILFIIIFIVVKIVQVILAKIFQCKILSSLDRVLGFFFGIVEGVAIVVLAIFVLCNQTFFDAGEILNGSFFMDKFNQFMSTIEVSGGEIYV